MLQPFCSSNSFKTVNLIPCTRERPGAQCIAGPKQGIWRWNSAVWEGNHFLGFSWPWQLTNAPGGGADTHNNVDHNIFQQMWPTGLAAWVYVYYFEIQNFNEKISKYRSARCHSNSIWECAKDRKAKFDPNSSHRGDLGKKLGKSTQLSRSPLSWKRHSCIACYALLYILLFYLYVLDIISYHSMAALPPSFLTVIQFSATWMCCDCSTISLSMAACQDCCEHPSVHALCPRTEIQVDVPEYPLFALKPPPGVSS